MSRSLWQLCFWAVPYGLGAGSADAALNNYVALHYASRQYQLGRTVRRAWAPSSAPR